MAHGTTLLASPKVTVRSDSSHWMREASWAVTPAVADQLFVVVDGEGWVSGEDEVRVDIKAGQAALWRAGESHESSTSSGMTAVVVEAKVVRPR